MKFSELPNHHALLLTHDERVGYTGKLWKELSSLSPAHRFFNQTVLDIETARSIIAWAQTPYHEERVGLISFASAGIPAQNAMLKILEEPRTNTRFILVVPSRSALIDTVLSRLQHIPLTSQGVLDEAYAFLTSPSVSRMKLIFIAELLAQTDEEGRKDREAIKGYILSLADALKDKRSPRRFVEETLRIASYASDPSASGKALLEYLSLLLPTIK